MAVSSTMLDLGTEAPGFALPDAKGQVYDLADTAGAPATVVAFICNHCPYVKLIGEQLGVVTAQFADQGVAVYGINSNDTDAYPDDAPDKMVETAVQYGWDFPYLLDTDQSVATAYRAACTPDLYVFDAHRRLVYRGQFDSARPSADTPVTGEDLVAAVTAVLSGQPVTTDQRPSMGCGIKWRPGNDPTLTT